jgi:hypothetical protein
LAEGRYFPHLRLGHPAVAFADRQADTPKETLPLAMETKAQAAMAARRNPRFR